MILSALDWDEQNVAHMARHHVTPDEVDEALFDGPVVWERGRNGRYYALSRTGAGRYLFVVLRYLGRGRARVITARPMTEKEKRRWRDRKGGDA
jgi:uncharacterized DUF497 family protein